METICVSVPEAARALSIGLTKTWELIGQGKLRTQKIGRRTLVLAASVRELGEGEREQR